MIQIQVKDKIVFIDDEDLRLFDPKKCMLIKSRGNIFCAVRAPHHILLQRLVMGNPPNRIHFKDGNRLNCQKENLVVMDKKYRLEYYRNYYKKNKKKMLQQCKEWALRNPEKVKARQERAKARYRYDENGKRREYQKIYRARPEVKTHYNAYYKDKRKEAKYRYNNNKKKAKERGLEFTLTFEQYENLISQPCHYSGESILGNSGVGLDRIDNSKGYTIDNVLPCAGWCNKMRMDFLTVEETKVAVRAVLELRSKKKTEGLIKVDPDKVRR